MELEGKTAVVTGSSRGIGKAIALSLAEEGASVAVNYPVEAEKENAQEVVDMIKNLGQEAVTVKANVVQLDEVKR